MQGINYYTGQSRRREQIAHSVKNRHHRDNLGSVLKVLRDAAHAATQGHGRSYLTTSQVESRTPSAIDSRNKAISLLNQLKKAGKISAHRGPQDQEVRWQYLAN